ncbi:MAG TPA: zinc-dependent alcohol dehydrogenase family protein [Acidimicrobiales bacterium]|nr:zinc-dependent alcohol dehydrogenase family protein [Acidimicrobiales bacterium]
MKSWVVDRPGPIGGHPLRLVEGPDPIPGPGQIRLRVRACGVCRTDLHLAEGDLLPVRPRTCPGHEIVGTVDMLGPCAGARFDIGDRIGVAWLGGTCGACSYCSSARENLCESPVFTGWHVAGGYAELALVDERFAYSLRADLDDVSSAPLLCAGIIGYRALRRTELPPGGRLGFYGFGASAHLTAQLAIAEGARLHVLTRAPEAQALALELGATSARGASEMPPEPLDGAILFAPVGELVLPALAALDRGGTLAIAGIHLSDIPVLKYQTHLFQERTLRSVTANTRRDGEEFLVLAARYGMRPTVTRYPMSAADAALRDLAGDRVNGAAVLVNDFT